MNHHRPSRRRSLISLACCSLVTSVALLAQAAEAGEAPVAASLNSSASLDSPTLPGLDREAAIGSQLVAPIAPSEPAKPSKGFLDFNTYPYMSDVDSDSVFTLNALAKLPHGFSYFSLLNVMNQSGHEPLSDTSGYYTEQNLRFSPYAPVPLDLTVQYNLRSGDDNDRLRFGFLWKLHQTPIIARVFEAISLSYMINFHVLQVDHEDAYVWQMEHIAQLTTPYLDRRLYIAGFADHTFNGAHPAGAPASPLVMEIQAGLRLIDELHVVAEYRVNEYRVDSPTNLALGGQYVARF